MSPLSGLVAESHGARRSGKNGRSHARDLARKRDRALARPATPCRELLEPDADTLELVPDHTTLINSVKNNGPECAERVPRSTLPRHGNQGAEIAS
jgi:hypothetical protein